MSSSELEPHPQGTHRLVGETRYESLNAMHEKLRALSKTVLALEAVQWKQGSARRPQ